MIPASPRRGSPGTASAHRLAAGRRRAVGLKLRRVVPGLVVGTTTLAGTGGLIAWVSGQPGVKTVVAVAARPTPSTTPAQMSAVQQQLQAEEAALQALQSRLGQIVAQSHAAASSGGTPVAGSTGGTASAPPLAPLPALPKLAPAPPPAVSATTGASHAVP